MALIATMQVETLFIAHTTVLAGEQISFDHDDEVSDEDLDAEEFDLEDDDQLDTESKSFLCPYEGCGKRYPKAAKLKQHLLSHTGEVRRN